MTVCRYPVREQKLSFQGVELEDDRSLLSYNIQPGSNLDLQVPDSPRMQIHVKTLSGNTASLDVQPSDKIIAVKAMIKEQLDISADKQHLVYIDKPLDNNRTLADYEIRDGGVIFLGMYASSCYPTLSSPKPRSLPPSWRCLKPCRRDHVH
jgi:hypothetical protein